MVQIPFVAVGSGPLYRGRLTHGHNLQDELPVFDVEFLLLCGQSFQDDGVDVTLHVSLDGGDDILAGLHLGGAALVVSHQLNHGAEVLRAGGNPCSIGLCLNAQALGVDLVGRDVIGEEIHRQTRAEAHGVVVRGDGTLGVGTAGTNHGSVFCADVLELTRRIDFCEAVEHQVGVLHRAVEVHYAAPKVGLARVGEIGSGQCQHAVALLHQAGIAGDPAATHRAGVGGVGDLGILGGGFAGSIALNPGGHVEGQNVGLGAVLDAHAGIGRRTHDDVLAVEARCYGAA